MSESDDPKQELLEVQYQLVTGKDLDGVALSSDARNTLLKREAELLGITGSS